MADRSHIQIEVEIGDVVVRLQANDESFIGKVRARSGPFLVDRAPDFSIELELGDDPTSIEHQQVAFSLHLTAADSYADGFPAAGEQSWVGWSNETLRLRLQRELFDFESPNRPRLLNVLFCAAYNTVCERQRSRSRHGYLMHGCGVLVGERAMLFTGRSGAGKSTTAALAGDRPVLNDEIVLLDFSGKSPRLLGTPFIGSVAARHRGGVPLDAVLCIEHGQQHRVTPLAPTDAYRAVLTQLLNSAPIFPTREEQRRSLEQRASVAAQLVHRGFVRRFSFLPEPSLWDALEGCQVRR